MMKRKSSNENQIVAGCCLMVALGLLGGCLTESEPDDPYVGNMNDYSYGGQITPEGVISRVSATGKKVSVNQFAGRFVWADYAAPWCGPCAPQAQAIKSLEARYPKRVVFLTVMTSKSPKYRDIPDQQTARAWARRFGLNGHRVVAANNLWGKVIPTHMLFSPRGQTLYGSTGYLSAAQIEEILNRHMRDWDRWERSGEGADWMRFD